MQRYCASGKIIYSRDVLGWNNVLVTFGDLHVPGLPLTIRHHDTPWYCDSKVVPSIFDESSDKRALFLLSTRERSGQGGSSEVAEVVFLPFGVIRYLIALNLYLKTNSQDRYYIHKCALGCTIGIRKEHIAGHLFGHLNNEPLVAADILKLSYFFSILYMLCLEPTYKISNGFLCGCNSTRGTSETGLGVTLLSHCAPPAWSGGVRSPQLSLRVG